MKLTRLISPSERDLGESLAARLEVGPLPVVLGSLVPHPRARAVCNPPPRYREADVEHRS